MRTIPPLLLDAIRREVANLAVVWAIERKDETFIRGTDHDVDIDLPAAFLGDDLAGRYLAGANITASDLVASSDMAVNNTEVDGAFQENAGLVTDVTVQEIESGLLTQAPVTIAFCDWKNPAWGYAIMQRGYLGEISRDSDRHYKTELRGLTQLLSQQIIRTFGETCDVVRFGDARCKFNVAAVTITATATTVLSRRALAVSGFTSQPVGYFSNGILRGLTGDNEGFEREVRIDNLNGAHGTLALWDAMPFNIAPGDTFRLEPGCDRRKSTCRDRWENIVNFRGHGWGIPGIDAIIQGPFGVGQQAGGQ